jgi:hypothetical protein
VQESSEEVEEHYCVVCEKRFRSAGQLSNHERSKKHQEALAELRQLLEEEEQDADWLLVRVEGFGGGLGGLTMTESLCAWVGGWVRAMGRWVSRQESCSVGLTLKAVVRWGRFAAGSLR